MVDDPEDLNDLLDFDTYVGVMNELGITPEINAVSSPVAAGPRHSTANAWSSTGTIPVVTTL